YGLDPRLLLFRSLRDLWDAEPEGQPLLAMLCALARDPLLRATAEEVVSRPGGAPVGAAMLADAVQAKYPESYSDSVRAKIGRNAASSWTQAGHLRGRVEKVRARATATPSTTAYAFLIGHLDGARGQGLLETPWGRALDSPDHAIYRLAVVAAQRGWI